MSSRWRWVFAIYAPALFVATHWPKLQVDGPIPRTDLLAHVTVFGGWGLLATMSGFFGEPLSRRNIIRTWMVGLVYAAIDEGLQAIPAIRRVASLDDYAANAMGITLAAVLLAVVAGVRRGRNGGTDTANNRA
jgi:VanZ family protein